MNKQSEFETLSDQSDLVSPIAQDTELAPVVSTLQRGLGHDLVSVVLYGSRARGDAQWDSDWDLFLIASQLPARPFRRHLYLKKMLPDSWRGRVSLLAKTPTEFEANLPALFLDIATDGIVLCDTNNYITDRLARINDHIRQQGLYREQHGSDLVWRWRAYPGHNWRFTWEGVL